MAVPTVVALPALIDPLLVTFAVGASMPNALPEMMPVLMPSPKLLTVAVPVAWIAVKALVLAASGSIVPLLVTLTFAASMPKRRPVITPRKVLSELLVTVTVPPTAIPAAAVVPVEILPASLMMLPSLKANPFEVPNTCAPDKTWIVLPVSTPVPHPLLPFPFETFPEQVTFVLLTGAAGTHCACARSIAAKG